jgi:hypothetical protein
MTTFRFFQRPLNTGAQTAGKKSVENKKTIVKLTFILYFWMRKIIVKPTQY